MTIKDTIGREDIIFVSVILCVTVFDQVTKYAIRHMDEVIRFGQYLTIQEIHNTGVSFGMLAGLNDAIVWIVVMVIGIILFFYDRIVKDEVERIGFSLIIGGAIGNLIDRFAFGYVIDFIDFSFWYAFNVADTAITIGFILLLFVMMKQNKKST